MTFHAFRNLIAALASAYALYLAAAFLLWVRVLLRRRRFIPVEAGGEDILIVAPHQDDCVAIAGGYGIQTKEKGGSVRVLYVTDGMENGEPARRSEAFAAWAIAGVQASDIRFLEYPTLTGLAGRAEIDDCIRIIEDEIRGSRPGTIFTPLYEGGHYQHDVVSYMTAEAVRRSGFKGRVFESPEYNFYLSFRATPEKILSGLLRFVPFAAYDYPPEPVRPDPVYRLAMTAGQLDAKRRMIEAFASQHPDMLKKRFGFEDRYQKMHDYDYRRPPFDYSRSAARVLDGLKRMPAAGAVFSKMFRWTRTIHPDPGVRMTRIPMRDGRSPQTGET